MSIKLKDTIYDLVNKSTTSTKATQDGSGNTITSTYYKTTGGTISGPVTISGGSDLNFIAGASVTNDPGDLVFKDNSGTEIGRFWKGAGENNFYVRFSSSGSGSKIWHAGNDGTNSGLDADLLDGNHASAFATSGHNHDSTYAPKSHSHSNYSTTDHTHSNYSLTSHGHTFASLSSKPTTLSGYGITDDISTIAFGGTRKEISSSTDLNNLDFGLWSSADNTTHTNGPGYQNFGLIVARLNTGYKGQLALPYSANSTHSLKYRSQTYSGSGYVWGSWRVILDSLNYGTYCAPSSHTHTKSQITDFSHTHNYASTVKVGSTSYNSSSNIISIPAYPTLSSLGAAASSHTHTKSQITDFAHSHSYYPLSGNTNMSGDNVWIGSTMGGGTDYWRIGGSGTGDNGICRITIGDNSNDKFQIQISDYSGTVYTPLEVTNNRLNVSGLANITANGRTLTVGSQNADHCHYSTDAPCHWFNKLVRVAGDVYGGSSYNRRLAYVDEVASSGHTHNYAGSDTPGGGANSVRNTGFGNGNFTWYQSSSSFFGSNWSSGWASYLISNHGDGKTYYNVTIALPFWGVPHYKRLEGGTEKGWYAFITAENIGSQSVNYANSAGNANTVDGYHISVGSSAGSDASTIYFIV